MKFCKKIKSYFSKIELLIWSISVVLIIFSFFLFDRKNILSPVASVTGVSAIILNAKGNPAGQVLMIIFSILYGIISLSYRYYGEMVTYLFMTMPMAVVSLISWLRHPYKGKKSEVEVNSINYKEMIFLFALSAAVTFAFYYILEALGTNNIIPSTLSVLTSFLAAYLTFRRSPMFSAAYALNDCILIVLWILASFQNIGYISVVVCFASFFVCDVYGYISWRKMYVRQKVNKKVF